MKKKAFPTLLVLFVCHFAQAQYKYDNTLFKTVFIEDLCQLLKQYPDRMILDVRSKGENADTSSSGLNIGHLRDAANIDVRELPLRWRELQAYKDKPLFVYCSHSQRSRRASKLLADSGFTQVININGGMTAFNQLKQNKVPCVKERYETNNKFSLITPEEIVTLLNKQPNTFILDVRKDSAFKGISLNEMSNALGRFKRSVNIPLENLQASLVSVPKNRPILVVDEFGTMAIKAAQLLSENGYNQLQVAFDGLAYWVEHSNTELLKQELLWEHPDRYTLINSIEFDRLLTRHPNTPIVDVRTVEEFSNKVPQKDYWRNRGHIQGAVNIPLSVLRDKSEELNQYKQQTVVVYAFGSSPEAFTAARMLADKGFTKVQVLLGGLWDLRWKAANLKGQSGLMKWVIDVPSDNL